VGPDASDMVALPTARRKKIAVEFDLDDNDAPILSEPSQMIARDMEPVVRQYMSIHYSGYFTCQMAELFYLIFLLLERCSGGKKSAVDWTALSENQDDMIHHKYLPDNFTFRDPSKMKKAHYRLLLEHWYKRQEDDSIDIAFAFKGYWDPSNDSVVTVKDKQPKSSLGKRRTAPALATSRLNGTGFKTAKKANAAQNRTGPPGIRMGEKNWQDYTREEENTDEQGEEEEDEDEEDEEDEDDSGDDGDDVDSGVGGDSKSRKCGMPSKVPPMDLPFSAKRVVRRGAPALPKKNVSRLPAVAQKSAPKSKAPTKKAREDMGTGKNHRDRTLDSEKLDATVIKRPQPRPARGGPQSDGAGPSVPQPVKPAGKRRYPDLGPQFERPTTRNGGKRKADDAELRAAGESSKKRAKRTAVKGEV
jgi:hypothetical protein